MILLNPIYTVGGGDKAVAKCWINTGKFILFARSQCHRKSTKEVNMWKIALYFVVAFLLGSIAMYYIIGDEPEGEEE